MKAVGKYYGLPTSDVCIAKRGKCAKNTPSVKANMTEVLPKIAWHYGEPYADPSTMLSYYVARETRKAVRLC